MIKKYLFGNSNKIIMAVMLLFIFTSIIKAQKYPGDPETHSELTAEPAAPTLNFIEIYDWSATGKGKVNILSWWRLKQLLGIGTSLLISNNNFSGTNTFSGTLSIPGSLQSATTNGIAIYSDKFHYATGNALETVATESFVADYIASEGIAGDLSIYSQKAANETFTGSKIMNNLFDARLGTLYLPYKTSLSTSTKTNTIYVYGTDGTIRASTKDESNNGYNLILADRDWVINNVSVTGLKSSETQTNITSSLTWNGGYINLAASKLVIGERASTGYGDITYSLTQGSDGIYYGVSDYSPSASNVDNRIAAKVNYTPYTIPASAIDVGLNYNVYQKTVSSETTFTFSNTTNKRLELWITNSGLSYIHFTAPSGYTIVYPDGFNQPFTGLHYYDIKIVNAIIIITKIMTLPL